ncbi:MAG: methyl-accepting chemotaxis protein [Defluviitaleaceae bacterium]|nr:methyl-accepting chemotaxis protein [Defluviitaleaceae bacterium]
MKNLKIRSKIILPTGLLVVVLLAVTLIFTIVQYNNFMEDLVHQRMDSAANSMRDFTEDIRRQVVDVGLQVSYDQRFIDAVLTANTQEILRVGNEVAARYGVTYITVAGTDAIVLARTDEPHRYGDEVATASLLEALEGIVSVAYSPVGVRQIPIRASVPLFHEGEIIGMAVVGYALDTPKAVEALRVRHDAEFTIFRETDGRHYRISSTLIDGHGNSVVGTYMTDSELLNTVFQQRQEWVGNVSLFGNDYIATYIPFYDPYGGVLGVVFMAFSMDEIVAQRATVIIMVLLISTIGLAIALAVLFLISGSIVRPIRKLVDLVSNVSQGKLNVNVDKNNLSTDEVGGLTRDVYSLVDVIREMVNDLTKAHSEYMVAGNVYYEIDNPIYQNSFEEAIGLVNKLLSQNTRDIMSMTSQLSNVSNGDFSIEMNLDDWPGDWAVIPQSLTSLSENLNAVSSEIGAMIDAAAVKGELNFRIDCDKYDGDWRKIMTGLNDIAIAVDEPLAVIAICLDEMKAGNFELDDIDSKITRAGYDSASENHKGVFRDILNNVDSTVSVIYTYIREISETLAEISNGNLTAKISRDYVGDFVAIKESLNNISETLNKTMSEINSASEQVLSGAKQISSSAMDLANGASTQASSVEELNASVDLINQQTQSNALNAIKANELSNTSTSNAREGNEAMQETLSAMNQIKEASNNISKIIRTIQDIAFQTNLLALNAAVEAARAGEHGKGFAVVAEEVRSLAARSQEAASETTTLIGTSINTVDSGAEIARSTAETLDTIVENANKVLDVVSAISTASHEQAEAISQVVQGLQQISQVVQSNSAVSEETAAASEELNSQAELLQQLVGYFKI